MNDMLIGYASLSIIVFIFVWRERNFRKARGYAGPIIEQEVVSGFNYQSDILISTYVWHKGEIIYRQFKATIPAYQIEAKQNEYKEAQEFITSYMGG